MTVTQDPVITDREVVGIKDVVCGLPCGRDMQLVAFVLTHSEVSFIPNSVVFKA